MSAFELSWYIKIDKQRNCGVKPQATLADSLPQIKTALDHSGVVSISLVDCPHLGPQRLRLRTENGSSVITLGEVSARKERVRGYSWGGVEAANDSTAQKPPADKTIVCAGADKVYEIFEEFFETGDVSQGLLN